MNFSSNSSTNNNSYRSSNNSSNNIDSHIDNSRFLCPVCNSSGLVLRHEARYIYSYLLDSDSPGLLNSKEFLSYQYDRRELMDNRTFVECTGCGTQFPYPLINRVLDREKGITLGLHN